MICGELCLLDPFAFIERRNDLKTTKFHIAAQVYVRSSPYIACLSDARGPTRRGAGGVPCNNYYTMSFATVFLWYLRGIWS
jgi:hypothetical protein